jgi:hypothetical protein
MPTHDLFTSGSLYMFIKNEFVSQRCPRRRYCSSRLINKSLLNLHGFIFLSLLDYRKLNYVQGENVVQSSFVTNHTNLETTKEII